MNLLDLMWTFCLACAVLVVLGIPAAIAGYVIWLTLWTLRYYMRG